MSSETDADAASEVALIPVPATNEALERAQSNDPAVNCVVCKRSRTACLPANVADDACLKAAGIALPVDDSARLKIIELATEVLQWADTANQIFVSLEAAYTGKTTCGWCKTVLEPGQGIPHSFVCTKNPLGNRLRELIAAVEDVNRGVGEELNIGDIVCALDNVLEQAKRPMTEK